MLPHLLLIAALSVNLTPTLGVAVHRREAEFRYGSAYVAPAADGSRPDWADAIWRAQQLVDQMTLEEKLNITQQYDNSKRVGAVPRLGYEGLFYSDGSNGIRGHPLASHFEQSLNTAATWDRDLMRRRAKTMAQECRTKGINVLFGPGVNIARDPRMGRAFEYNGQDPYLAGVFASEHTQGVQGEGVIAMMRHYIGNDQESGRVLTSSNFDDRTAHELYLWPFQDAVEAGIGATMGSYNGVNGIHANAKNIALGKWLREELNYQGWVLSDCNSIYLGLEAESANAGMDSIICGTTFPYHDSASFSWAASSAPPFGINSSLSKAVDEGRVPESRIHDMAVRMVASWYKLGQDNDFPALDSRASALHPATNDFIRESGARSIVLLKNVNDTLPLCRPEFVYLFGSSATTNPNGAPHRNIFNPNPAEYTDQGAFAGGQGSSHANLPYQVTLNDALTRRARDGSIQLQGWYNNYDREANMAAAREAESYGGYCIVDVRHECGEGWDRANMSAIWEGDRLIMDVAAICSNTVVNYGSCGAFNATEWHDHSNITAILNSGGLGQEVGNSVADVLFGDVNPSAKLPYTMPRLLSDMPAQIDFDAVIPVENRTDFFPVNYTEGLFTDYRHYDKHGIEPLWEFGFGLSYTTFSINGIWVDFHREALNAQEGPRSRRIFDEIAWVTVEVVNTGKVKGREVAQLYLGSPAEGAPVKVLRGFEVAHLAPGDSRSITFPLTRRDVSYWDIKDETWTIPEGEFQIYVGSSSRDIKQTATLSFAVAD